MVYIILYVKVSNGGCIYNTNKKHLPTVAHITDYTPSFPSYPNTIQPPYNSSQASLTMKLPMKRQKVKPASLQEQIQKNRKDLFYS